jgi:transposase-like protein
MVLLAARCPYCHSDQMSQRGQTGTGKHRYRCQNPVCPHQSFVLDPAYKGRLPAIKPQAMERCRRASGMRDMARVVQSSTDTVMKELKKQAQRSPPCLHPLGASYPRATWTSWSIASTTLKATPWGAL